MTSQEPSPTEELPLAASASPPPPRRRRLRRPMVLAVAAATAVVLAGGAVAWAAAGGGDGGGTADDAAHGGQSDGDGDGEHGHGGTDHDAVAGDDASAGEQDGTATGMSGAGAEPGADVHTDADGMGGRHGPHGDRAGHPTLPPYGERLAEATQAEREAADALLADARTTLSAFADVDAAVAAGYRAPHAPRGLLAHYLDPDVVRASAEGGAVLDPAQPAGLVYQVKGGGAPVLVGAFFVAPRGTAAPRPAGDLVVWHSHDEACPAFFATEDEPCIASRRMLHVWTAEEVTVTARRTGQPETVRIVDPFGAPFVAVVERTGN